MRTMRPPLANGRMEPVSGGPCATAHRRQRIAQQRRLQSDIPPPEGASLDQRSLTGFVERGDDGAAAPLAPFGIGGGA
jgi:hypothetical protein